MGSVWASHSDRSRSRLSTRYVQDLEAHIPEECAVSILGSEVLFSPTPASTLPFPEQNCEFQARPLAPELTLVHSFQSHIGYSWRKLRSNGEF